MAKTKIVRKNPYIGVLEAKGSETGQVSAGRPKRGFFCHVLIPFHLLTQKRSTIKVFPELSLVSLTLECALSFKIFEKMQAILLY